MTQLATILLETTAESIQPEDAERLMSQSKTERS